MVWRIKYKDANGVQVQETLGRSAEGWTKRKAEGELRARLTAVAKDGLRKIEAVTFATFSREWLDSYPLAKSLKRSTASGYEQIIERHLSPFFGSFKLDAIDVQRIEEYVAAKRRSGLAPRTLNRHLNLLKLAHGGGGQALARALESGAVRGQAA